MTTTADGFELKSSIELTSSGDPEYVFHFPMRDATRSYGVTDMCSATVIGRDDEGFNWNILTFSSKNRGRRAWEDVSPSRTYYTRDREFFNLDIGDWEFSQGGSGNFEAQMFMRYGMASNSFCIVQLPRYFVWDDSTTLTGGNMSDLIWKETLTVDTTVRPVVLYSDSWEV